MNKFLLGGVAAVSSLLVSVQAHAAAAEAFTTAVTATTTDIGTYGVALVGLSAVGVGFGIAMKYIKRIRGAA